MVIDHAIKLQQLGMLESPLWRVSFEKHVAIPSTVTISPISGYFQSDACYQEHQNSKQKLNLLNLCVMVLIVDSHLVALLVRASATCKFPILSET